MKTIFLFLFAGLISQAAWAGWVVTYQDVELGEKSQEFYDGQKYSTRDFIYTGKQLVAIDTNSRAYWKGSPEQFCKAIEGLRKMMEAQMASMPAQYRPLPMEKRNVTLKKLGAKSIAGFNAKGYVFFADGGIQIGEVWVSSDPALSGIINFEKSSAKKMKCFDDMANDSLEGSSLYKKTVENQFILKEPGREVISVEKKGVSSSHFKVPDGYKSFSDYQSFMNHVSGAADFSSNDSSGQNESSYDEPQQISQATASKTVPKGQADEEDNIIVKDAKDIAGGAVDEAHQGLKKGVQDEVSKDIKKGVRNVLDKFF